MPGQTDRLFIRGLFQFENFFIRATHPILFFAIPLLDFTVIVLFFLSVPERITVSGNRMGVAVRAIAEKNKGSPLIRLALKFTLPTAINNLEVK